MAPFFQVKPWIIEMGFYKWSFCSCSPFAPSTWFPAEDFLHFNRIVAGVRLQQERAIGSWEAGLQPFHTSLFSSGSFSKGTSPGWGDDYLENHFVFRKQLFRETWA